MAPKYDVAIVGAGPTGLSPAPTANTVAVMLGAVDIILSGTGWAAVDELSCKAESAMAEAGPHPDKSCKRRRADMTTTAPAGKVFQPGILTPPDLSVLPFPGLPCNFSI